MEPEASFQHSQKLSIGPYPKPVETNLHSQTSHIIF